MDFCPAFWDWIKQAHGAGKVFSVGQVKSELARGHGDDALLQWAKTLPGSFFLPDANAEFVRKVGECIKNSRQGYTQTAIIRFLDAQKADSFLIAKALEVNACIVTQEISSESKKRIKIPDVCDALKVKWMPTHDMLRQEGARFVLG